MLRTSWFQNAAAAKAYYRASDYLSTTPAEWLGKGAAILGVTGATSPDQFDSLADNLHPQTGEQLTTYTRDNRRVGLDMTFNAVKSVSLARELAGESNAGDSRIEQAHREAVKYTVGLIEQDMQARVRTGGANGNRTTGNLVAYRVTHRDTRINADDQMPDPNLHDHCFIFNATYDPVEQKWKAAEIGQIKHDAPFYEAVYANRLAGNLKGLGYGIERKGKAYEIAGVSQELRDKFSRRTKYIEKVAAKLGIEKPESKSKLGATTRLGKTKEVADDLNGYYAGRLTPEEKQQLATLQGRPSREVTAEQSVAYAIGHEFERRSVVDEKRLYETALRYGVGCVTPEGIQAEAKRQGLLTKNREATTKAVLAEEQRIIAFARDGRGTCRAMEAGTRLGESPNNTRILAGMQLDSATVPARAQPKTALAQNVTAREQLAAFEASPAKAEPSIPAREHSLSPEQAVMVNHVLTSADRVMLVIGDAGTGKTFAVKSAFERIGRPVDILAPSAAASRGVLRRDGFTAADTVAAFLGDLNRQAAVRNGVIWVDEAGLLPIRDLSALVDVAEIQNARLVLQGDPKQHRAVARDGNMLNVLQTHAGLPVARLKDVRRQKGRYKEAVTALAEGRTSDGLDALNDIGWVRQSEDNQPLVDAYLEAVDTKRPDQDVSDRVLAIAPTHAEASEVTAAIRTGLKARGLVGGDEHTVRTLAPLHWTEAERGDVERYTGAEVLQFHRNSGTFKAGDRVAVADFKPGQRLGKSSTYAVYAPGEISLAAGDRIRITANGWTADKKHRLDNGAQYAVAGFEPDGRIRLTNGWFVAPDFGHLTHGYVTTSHASQGRTVDRVLIAMGSESLPAINRQQFYVSVSRGRESARIYSEVSPATLRDAVQRADDRKSAMELLGPRRRREWWLSRRARAMWQALRGRMMSATPEREKQREQRHER